MHKFKRAQARNQSSIEKYLAEANTLYSSSDDDDDEKNQDALQLALAKVVSSYQGAGGDTDKSLSYLTDIFQSGRAICLICISSVKKMDPIWSCSTCFSFMHLECVQHWIRDSLSYKRERGTIPLWACPKCRTEYREDEAPSRYLCFCGKMTDPPYQPWAIPHSCDEKCDKPLLPSCGHYCLLRCHPGPCPPCPRTVRVKCFCEGEPARTCRCNAREWSCGKICSKKLPNCDHLCAERCHSRANGCPPCNKMVSVSCRCGNETKNRVCSEADWSCGKPCGRRLSCNVHVCEGYCHRPDDCGECPTEKNRTCPCGKKRYRDVTCEQQHVPTCGDTCGKPLDCGFHYCNMRCHTNSCGTCVEVLVKSCRCGSYEKEIVCSKEFHCNKRCTRMRACGIHVCHKKCCDCRLRNSLNVCESLCDNMLNCQIHKCSAPCHSGPCFPCPRTIDVLCSCGKCKIVVPCGRVKRKKPPNCNQLCKIPLNCHHTKREPHKCHQGRCQPCRQICGLVRKKCGHPCTATCHTKVWVKSGTDRSNNHVRTASLSDSTGVRLKTLPCPPCEVPVMTTCPGNHETLTVPCHRAKFDFCQRLCGRLLACTNHTCELPCHRVSETSNGNGDSNVEVEITNCEECSRPCSLPRPEGCTHLCPKFCHKGPCQPCERLVKVQCHCGINSLYIECVHLTTRNNDQKLQNLLRCGNRCPKNYPCGHRCVDKCHYGECPNAEGCTKRIKIWCPCKRLKKDISCIESRVAGTVAVDCDETCHRLRKERDRDEEMKAARKRKAEEAKNRIEVERFERKFKPRRGARGTMRSSEDERSLYDVRSRPFIKIFVVLCVLSVAIAWVVFRTELRIQ